MIGNWSPEARLVLAFVVAPLGVPLLCCMPFVISLVPIVSIRGELAFSLFALIVGAAISCRLLGAVAGFLSALLFWVIALWETQNTETMKELI